MKAKITESEWLAVLGNEIRREAEPPPGAKLTSEIATIWKVSEAHAGRLLRQLRTRGKTDSVKVRHRVYWLLCKSL